MADKLKYILEKIIVQLPKTADNDELLAVVSQSLDARIIDLPLLNVQSDTDIFEISKNGAGSFKTSRAQFLPAGSWVPVFSNLVGISGIISITSAYYVQIKNILIFSHEISFTATDSAVRFSTTLPIAVTFTSPSQATLLGQSLSTAAATAADGSVLKATADTVNNLVTVQINATVGSGTKYVSYSVLCKIQ